MNDFLVFALFVIGVLLLAVFGALCLTIFDMTYLVPWTLGMGLIGVIIVVLIDLFIIVGVVLPIMYFLGR